MRKYLFPVIIAVMIINTSYAFSQDIDQIQIRTEHISGGTYVLYGSGGNIGVSAGDDGFLIIDSQFAEFYDKITAALSEIGKGDVKFVLNTNWHYDHVSGNAAFVKSGAVVLAHAKSRERMMSEQSHPFFDMTVPAYAKEFYPTVAFTDQMTLYFNDDKIQINHHEKAHSDADLVFWFRNSNVVHTGDILFTSGYPFIDVPNGGTSQGVILAVEKILRMTNENTKFIPGHGSLTDYDGIKRYKYMLETIRGRIDKLVSAGKNLDEIIAAKPTAEFDKENPNWIEPDGFVLILFNDLTGKYK
jgi:glyoxylase-like metal-dependent hydrolase (beta-lactamase superfamily II)